MAALSGTARSWRAYLVRAAARRSGRRLGRHHQLLWERRPRRLGLIVMSKRKLTSAFLPLLLLLLDMAMHTHSPAFSKIKTNDKETASQFVLALLQEGIEPTIAVYKTAELRSAAGAKRVHREVRTPISSFVGPCATHCTMAMGASSVAGENRAPPPAVSERGRQHQSPEYRYSCHPDSSLLKK